MTERADRVYKRKRIKNPNDETQYFDVPVIYEMKFRVMQEQAQDRWLYLNNSTTSSRQVRVQRVHNVSSENQYVDAERVVMFKIKDMVSQAQDIEYHLSNNDPPPIQPDGTNSPAHQQVHYVRYYKDNDTDSNSYGDMELIDEMIIRDGTSQAQEWHYFLRWPQLGTIINDPNVPYTVTLGYCDPSLPLASEEGA